MNFTGMDYLANNKTWERIEMQEAIDGRWKKYLHYRMPEM